ncbi:MAG: YraN family protein [Lachnospiraceae bacterium]|nr:YraN family protein [Lachnospiraceae bacterium]
MKKENMRKKGTVYEEKAVLFLQEKGYRILERNFYTKFGEIDIIARDGDYTVFIEVKYRKNGNAGEALEAVTQEKQRRLFQSAKVYLYVKKYRLDLPCRFDVIAFQGEEMRHIENAFSFS